MVSAHWWSGLDLRRSVVEQPSRFTANQLIRLLAALNAVDWEPGRNLDPAQEAVRFAGYMGGAFPAGEIASAQLRNSFFDGQGAAGADTRGVLGRVEIASLTFGGPQGPLPSALVDSLWRRARAGDRGALAFLDIFTHRLVSVGFRSERAFRPDLESRAPEHTRAHEVARAIAGLHGPAALGRAGVPDAVLMRYGPLLARRPVSSAALGRMLGDIVGTRVRYTEAVGRWLTIATHERNRVAARWAANNTLGVNLVLGGRSWLQTGGLHFTTGPLPLNRFAAMLPGGRLHQRVRALLRFALNTPSEVTLTLCLAQGQTPAFVLGGPRAARLGWTSWFAGEAAEERRITIRLLASEESI